MSDTDGPADLESQLEALDIDEDAREQVLDAFDSPGAVIAAGDARLMSLGLEAYEAATVMQGLDADPGPDPAATSRPDGGEPAPTANGDTPPGDFEETPQPADTDTPLAEASDPQQRRDPAPEASTDSTDSTDDTQRTANRAGEVVGYFIFGGPTLLVKGLLAFLRGVVGFVPGRSRIYQKMIRAGYKQLYKQTNAHVVVDAVYADGDRVPRPAEVDREENKLKTSNGEWWTVSTGMEKQFVGDTPVVTGVADQHETVDHVGARVAEAADLGTSRYTPVERTQAGIKPATNGAMADGGEQLAGTTFDDVWLDASNPTPDNDGWIVSLRKHYEMHFDRAGSEEMERQETRGVLSAQEPDERSEWLKLLIFVGGLALGLFGPALASAIAGGSGGVPGGLGTIMLGVLL